MTQPLITQNVSVIIPCYNAARTLARALNSCLAQTHVAQIIVVDDASTDSSVDVIKYYGLKDPRIELLTSIKNSGPAVARNRGVEHSTQPIVAFLDADDEYLPSALAAAVNYLNRNPLRPAVRLTIDFSSFPAPLRTAPDFERHSHYMSETVTSALVMRRPVFLALGGFPEDEIFRRYGGEDSALATAINEIFGCYRLTGKAWVRMHYHENSHAALYFLRSMGVAAEQNEYRDVTAAIDRFVENARRAVHKHAG